MTIQFCQVTYSARYDNPEGKITLAAAKLADMDTINVSFDPYSLGGFLDYLAYLFPSMVNRTTKLEVPTQRSEEKNSSKSRRHILCERQSALSMSQ